MRYEMRTRTAWLRGEPELVWEIHIHPRGGANRSIASGLAKIIRANARLTPHIRTVKVFTSKVSVHFKASLGMFVDVLAFIQECQEKQADRASNQLPLFDPSQGVFALPKT